MDVREYRITGAVAAAGFLLICSFLYLSACDRGPVRDEALLAQRTVKSFPAADEDYFADMDRTAKDTRVALSAGEIRGRNMWNLWSGGNDRFWDTISRRSVGTLDLLKIVSSYDPDADPNAMKDPKQLEVLRSQYRFNRSNRWRYLGLLNEPCFSRVKGPDSNRFGLWLDKRESGSGCPADPFENETKYPGVKIGSRGKNMTVGSAYGYGSGILGLRLFPNPEFDEAAQKVWDPERYYTDPTYYNRKDLVKPYRVGMSCGFCHIGANPINPPPDPENPKFEHLSSYVGAQYFWVDRIFAYQGDSSSFAFQLFHTSRPGTLDTSLVSTDNVNNPRTMNAIYNLGARLEVAKRFGHEILGNGSLNNKQFNDFVPPQSPLGQFFKAPDQVLTPRVLKDGADSVGALGALNRVYLNIGLFSEDWLTHFNALVGGKRSSPMSIKTSRENSIYWQVTEAQTPDMALFFLKAANPHKLANADDRAEPVAVTKLAMGKHVFAERCARCHSSKLPSLPPDKDPGAPACAGKNYLACFNSYWTYSKTEEFKNQMHHIVNAPEFLENNFLAAEIRVPVTLLQTNSCSPLAANALRGNIWDNFSSESYKDLPSVGTVQYRHPYTGEVRNFQMPAGGRGYTRPASLVSLWSTAPYLLNNTVGKLSRDEDVYNRYGYNPSPSVENRLWAFNDGITKMLWPEKRDKDSLLGSKGVMIIDRTTHTSYLRVPNGYLPEILQGLTSWTSRYLPAVFGAEGVEIGPIPSGTPVNLLSNLQLLSESSDIRTRTEHTKRLVDLLLVLKRGLKALPPNATDADARRVFANAVEPLINMSTCPDYEVNRGHYFGTDRLAGEEPGLSDGEKFALIEFLKTL